MLESAELQPGRIQFPLVNMLVEVAESRHSMELARTLCVKWLMCNTEQWSGGVHQREENDDDERRRSVFHPMRQLGSQTTSERRIFGYAMWPARSWPASTKTDPTEQQEARKPTRKTIDDARADRTTHATLVGAFLSAEPFSGTFEATVARVSNAETDGWKTTRVREHMKPQQAFARSLGTAHHHV